MIGKAKNVDSVRVCVAKTLQTLSNIFDFVAFWEVLFVEKGLSKINESIRKIEFLFQNIVGEDIPLKQGLKLRMSLLRHIVSKTVGEDIPLKQGLKPSYFHRLKTFQKVGEDIPLKQGLKQY